MVFRLSFHQRVAHLSQVLAEFQLCGDLLAPSLLAVGPLVGMKLPQLLVVRLFDLLPLGRLGRLEMLELRPKTRGKA